MTLKLSSHILIAPSEIARDRALVSDMDLLRLKIIARLHARGLPPHVTWDDLLQEAFTRVLSGARVPPPGIGMVPFLAGVMRSLRSEHWRRAAGLTPERLESVGELMDPAADPERVVMSYQQLNALDKLFEGDEAALKILQGLAEGLSPEEIRARAKLSKTVYDSARKRIRRTLLREGLRICHP